MPVIKIDESSIGDSYQSSKPQNFGFGCYNDVHSDFNESIHRLRRTFD